MRLIIEIIGRLIMSKFDFAKLRDQVRKTNEELKKTFKGTDSHFETIFKREQNGWAEITKKAQQSKEWIEAQKKKNQELTKDPKWLEATTLASQKKAQDPKWLEANLEGCKKRKQKGQELKQQGKEKEYRELFGVKDQHTKKTKKQMSISAKERWAKRMKQVSIQGKIYQNIYQAADDLGIHKDTVVYRIKTKPKDHFYIEEK